MNKIVIKSFARNVVLLAPDNINIEGIIYNNKNEHRFGQLMKDAVVTDDTGKEHEAKEGDWLMVCASTKVVLGEQYYMIVKAEEIGGIVQTEVTEGITFKGQEE